MKARIYFEYESGLRDSIVLEGELEEVQKQAHAEVEKRQPVNYWSQILEYDPSGETA